MSYFVGGTAYVLVAAPVPRCFLDLDKLLSTSDAHFPEKLRHPTQIHGSNLCRRMGDVELYTELIAKELAPKEERNAALVAIATGTLLVGHYSACKAVLDAAAIALTTVYQLGLSSAGTVLSQRDMDLGKGRFWTSLRKELPATYDRYIRFRPFVDDVRVRRDAAVHRLGPLVMPNNRRYYHISTMEVTLAEVPDARIGDVDLHGAGWVDPLHYHRTWLPDLLALCDEVCHDLADYYAANPPPPPPPDYEPT